MSNLLQILQPLKSMNKKTLIGLAILLSTCIIVTNLAKGRQENLALSTVIPTDLASDDSAIEMVNKLVIDNKRKDAVIDNKFKELTSKQQENELKRQQDLTELKNLIKSQQRFGVKNGSPGISAAELKAMVASEVALAAVSNDNSAHNTNHDYMVQGSASDTGAIDEIVWLEDLSGDDGSFIDALARPKDTKAFDFRANDDVTKRYTIAKNATLMNSTLLTPLIGRVPVMGKVTSPYPFKMLIGADNLISNGIELPDVKGIVAQGEAVGDMALHCASGKVHSLTFTFHDGSIVTHNGSDSNPIGFISDSRGNPCIRGNFITNAAEFLATQTALSATQGAAEAFSKAQYGNQLDQNGNAYESLTGSIKGVVAGNAISSSASSAAEWHMARIKDSFDVVYVPQDSKVALHIEQEIPIDLTSEQRKVRYDGKQKSANGPLD